MTVEGLDVVDRAAELELFRRLLTFEDDARLLAINDLGGRGKSTLLRRLRYNCLWENTPQVANSLLFLDQHQEWRFFDLIRAIYNDLETTGLFFPEFGTLHTCLASQDFGPFKRYADASIEGYSDLRGSKMYGGKQAGVIVEEMINVAHSRIPWNAEMEEEARKKCINAFLKELMNISNERPIVIMFDAWEKCRKDLRDDILIRLVQRFCFDLDNRPRWFILVIAGREQLPFKQILGDTRFSQLVRSKESLSKWERKHVKAFLTVNGCKETSDDDIDIIFNKISQGLSLQAAIDWATAIQNISRPVGS